MRIKRSEIKFQGCEGTWYVLIGKMFTEFEVKRVSSHIDGKTYYRWFGYYDCKVCHGNESCPFEKRIDAAIDALRKHGIEVEL